MSKKAVKEPTAAPRSASGTRSTVRAIRAGNTSENPAPNPPTPTKASAGAGARPPARPPVDGEAQQGGDHQREPGAEPAHADEGQRGRRLQGQEPHARG